jgi:hypothetical protein
MSTAQARVIDPILTTAAQGYTQADFVGSSLFPTVPVSARGGKILSFGKEDFMLYATARAPGANTRRVQFGYLGLPYALESHSLEGLLPIENYQEGMAVPGIDNSMITVRKTQKIIAMRLEKQQADIARTAASYAAANKITLSGTSQFSDFSGTSDPIAIIEAGREAVRRKIGVYPNTGVIGAAVFTALKQHPKIIARTVYTGRDVPTLELLASFFELDKLTVGKAVYADDSGAFVDIWGKDIVLAYTAIGTMASQGEPSYGYTYQLGGYPVVEVPYYERNVKSFVYPVTDEVAPVIASIDSGYLITNAVA